MEEEGLRPTKLNEAWIRAFESVVNMRRVSDHGAEYEVFAAIYLTDEELCMLTNEEYGEDDYISYRTFQRWIAGELESDLIGEFCRVYKKAIMRQKLLLFQMLDTDEKWQRHAWKIERKFPEWNLQLKMKLSGDKENPMEVKESKGFSFLDEVLPSESKKNGGKKKATKAS